MSLYTLPNATSGGDALLVQLVSQVNIFTPLLLTFIWFIIFLGGLSRQKARTGSADFPMWAVVACLSILILSLIMTTITGVLQLGYLVIVIVLTVFSGVWLFLDKRRGEI